MAGDSSAQVYVTEVFRVDFKNRSLDWVEREFHEGQRPKGKVAIKGFRKKLEGLPTLPPPTIEEAVNLSFEALVANSALGTDHEIMEEFAVQDLIRAAEHTMQLLNPEDRQEAQRRLAELTSPRAPRAIRTSINKK